MQERQLLDCPITKKGIYEAIASMKLNKAPSPDICAIEFYKKNSKWTYAQYWTNVFAYCTKVTCIPESWTFTKTIIIPKQRKHLTMPEIYKPISLLNVDYKILTIILTSL